MSWSSPPSPASSFATPSHTPQTPVSLITDRIIRKPPTPTAALTFTAASHTTNTTVTAMSQ